MGRAEGGGDLPGDVDDVVEAHGAAPDPLGQEFPVEVLHHEVGGAVRELPEVADVHDVGVADRGRRLRLAHEAPHDLLVAGDLAAEDLHREALVQRGVGREVDDAHAALPEDRFDEVAPIDDGPDQRVDGDLGVGGDFLERLPVMRAEAHLVGETSAAYRANMHSARILDEGRAGVMNRVHDASPGAASAG